MGLILVSTACFVLETQKNYWSDSTVDPECCWRTNSNGDIKFMLPGIDVFGVDGVQHYEESEETRYMTPECSCTTEGLGKVTSMLGVRTCVEAMCKFYEATSTNTSQYKLNEPACICEPQPLPFFAVSGWGLCFHCFALKTHAAVIPPPPSIRAARPPNPQPSPTLAT